MRDFSMKAPIIDQNDEANIPPPYGGAPFDADGGKMPPTKMTTDDVAKLNRRVDRRRKEKKNGNRGGR